MTMAESTSEPKANVLTVPLNDDGTFGPLPEPLQKFLDSRISQVAKRYEKQADRLPDPVERERLRQLEEENQRFKVGEAEREKRYEEALKMREDEWSKRFRETEAQLERRTQKVVQLIGAEIRAAALKHGARDESLEDIEALLDRRVALNDDLEPVVLDDKGEATDLTIDALVKGVLDRKPYFRVAPAPGGGARGGAFAATGAVPDSLAAQMERALDAYQQAPTPENMNLYLALQRQATAAGQRSA